MLVPIDVAVCVSVCIRDTRGAACRCHNTQQRRPKLNSGSQGFSPHFDDVEAFVLQLAGAKTWALYAPPSNQPGRTLPRNPSRNLSQSELPARPDAEVTLRAGDLLYFPRGWVHQCVSCGESNEHSLHLTVSCGHRSAWADFLDDVLPNAVARCAAQQVRATLPGQLPTSCTPSCCDSYIAKILTPNSCHAYCTVHSAGCTGAHAIGLVCGDG